MAEQGFPGFQAQEGKAGPDRPQEGNANEAKPLGYIFHILNSIYHRHYKQYQLVPELRI
jgi:hypothetical protein